MPRALHLPRTVRGRRLFLGLLVLVLVAVVVVVVVARSSGDPDHPVVTEGPPSGSTYLALGDSVPFGYRSGDIAQYPDPSNFTGYPELVARDLHLTVLDASCPGETTASFQDTAQPSNGCEGTPQTPGLGYRTAFPLHVAYALPESQLTYAERTLRARRDVQLVSLTIGANDAFLCQSATADRCASEVPRIAAEVGTGLRAILSALRTQGGYTGRVVVVTYYALGYTGSDRLDASVLDTALTSAAHDEGATVADGLAAFRPQAQAHGGDPVAAGLVIKGDIHPTAAGQRLLADALERALG